MKVINEESVGSEVKREAFSLMANLANDATNRSKIFSEFLLKVS